MSSKLWCQLLLLAIALTGCATERWIPPVSPHGRLCTEECRLAQQQCQGGQQMAIANCANTVQTELHAYNDPNIDSEMACADAAYQGSGGSYCQHRYRQCFIGCGGLITD